jgi:hypothetical protein
MAAGAGSASSGSMISTSFAMVMGPICLCTTTPSRSMMNVSGTPYRP